MPACQLLGQCLGKDVDPLPARGACRGLARLPIGRGLLQGLPVCAGIAAVGLVIIVIIIVVVVVRLVALTAVLAVFFFTRPGMAIRATGDNEEMVRSSSINADLTRTAAVMLANALVALSGALLCQQQRYADLNCGSGMLVMGLASVIIGRVLFGDRGIVGGLISAVGGSLLYRIIIQAAYKIEMPSYGVKLLSTLIVICALAVPLLAKRRQPAQKGGAR